MGLFSFLNKSKQDADDDIDVPVKPRRRAKAQEEEPIDPMLPEKKRARRRLIGATALVLAAVIGLPMIFDSEPKPLTDDIAIQIPSRDKSSGASLAKGSAGQPLSPTATEHAEVARPAPTPPAEPPVAEKLPSAEAIRPQAEKPAVKAEDKPAEKPADKVVEKATDKPASAKSGPGEGQKEKSATEKTKSAHFILQVAAVANKAKAEELQNRLKQAGIKSYSQKVSTKEGERYRVRVGPFGSRDEADKMRARLSKMGLSAAVQPV